MRPGLSFRDSRAGSIRSDDAPRQSPRFTECGAGLSSARIRPLTDFAKQSKSCFEFGQRWIASSQVLLAMTDDAALSDCETHPAATALGGIAVLIEAWRLSLAGLRFFCGIFS